MWLRHQGAKRPMGKYLTPNCRRRPNLDPLESRCLLSGGIEVIEVYTAPAPALVIPVDFRQTPHPVDGFRSAAMAPVSNVPGDWQMPGFHHDFSPMDGLSTPAMDSHIDLNPLVALPLISPASVSENAAVSPPSSESESMASENMAAVPAPSSHGDVPPGLPPPGQPPPFLFFGGDPGRFLHAARDLATRPAPDETTQSYAEGTSQTDDVTVSFAVNILCAGAGWQLRRSDCTLRHRLARESNRSLQSGSRPWGPINPNGAER